MKLLKSLLLTVTICSSILFCSCTTTQTQPAPAGISNERYSWGTYKADFGTTLFMMDKAVRCACARARLTKTEHAFRTSYLEYTFKDVQKNEISITIKELPKLAGVTMKLRIGRWGDKDSSFQLAAAIDEELRLLAAAPQD